MGQDCFCSVHRAEIQIAKLLVSRKVPSARLQPGKDLAIVIDEIGELLAALDEVGIPVHKEFFSLDFADNLPHSYEYIKNNLPGSKEPLTSIVLEDALRSRYNVQSGGKKGRTTSGTALFDFGSKAGRGAGRGGGCAGTNKGKLDNSGRNEGLSSQSKVTCNHCQKTGHIRLNCLERHCFRYRRWVHEVVPCPSKAPTLKENGDLKKKTSQLLRR